MKAIHTTYHGPTNTRGSRMTATAGSNRVTISCDNSLDADGNHDAAALALCEKMGWTQHHLMRGTLENAKHQSIGNVYTFDDPDNRVMVPIKADSDGLRARTKLYLEDHPEVAGNETCYRCGRKIRDAEYEVTGDGMARHLNACPS